MNLTKTLFAAALVAALSLPMIQAASCSCEGLLAKGELQRALVYESSSEKSLALAPWMLLAVSLILNFLLIVRR